MILGFIHAYPILQNLPSLQNGCKQGTIERQEEVSGEKTHEICQWYTKENESNSPKTIWFRNTRKIITAMFMVEPSNVMCETIKRHDTLEVTVVVSSSEQGNNVFATSLSAL